jgi:3-hydroxyisobutyrate dehydrogenase
VGGAWAGATLDRIAGHAGLLLRKDVGLVNDLAVSADAPAGTLLAAANDALTLMNVTT